MTSGGISAELVQAAVHGDEQAIVSLLDAAQPDIRRCAVFHCLSREDAEDATQETLWQLYRRIGTLRTAAALPGWMKTVVRRTCARMRKSHPPLIDDAAFMNRPDLELRMDVASAIESLPEHYREIVVLRDVQDMKIDEISAQLGLTREAVKGRLHRARVLMREYLMK